MVAHEGENAVNMKNSTIFIIQKNFNINLFTNIHLLFFLISHNLVKKRILGAIIFYNHHLIVSDFFL